MKKILIVIAFLFVTVDARAEIASLSWNANIESDLAGYKVYFGTATGVYGLPIDVGNVTTFDVPGLDGGTTYFFAVTAYDVAGNESGFSNEVSKLIVDGTAPSNPSGLTVIQKIAQAMGLLGEALVELTVPGGR